ncbi:MAG TPA: efflux RND transporter periplasmic adaptor subunit [Caulobacteraceae bacterium]
MRFKPQYLVVGAFVVLVFAYLLLRPLMGAEKKAHAATAKPAGASAPPLVQVSLAPEMQHPWAVTFRGRTQAFRTVVVRSETAGPVAATPVLQGTVVRAGTVLCRLAVDARQAMLDEMRANMRAKSLQMQASANLAAKGYRSRTQVLSAQADLDSASAAVRQAEVALRQVDIRAPFAGVFDHRDAEVGTYLAPGQPCGTMIQLDPLLIVGDVPETDVGKLRIGDTASAKLVSGATITGRVRFVASDADPTTRTYRVEVTSANPGGRTASGLSAELAVRAGIGAAHKVPVSALVLDAAGRQGVRYVAAGQTVAFAPVTVLEVDPDGVWVTGLNGDASVITVGQSYVSEGQRVRVAAR